nr:glycosyltransferase family 4 protein [Marinobacter daepoensis]
MSKTLRNSFISDFGLPEDKVIYAGFGSPFGVRDVKEKSYSSKNILFVASHSFESKGGKDLLAAFRKIRKLDPEVTLTLVGREWGVDEPGVKCIGFLDKRNAEDLRKYHECFELASIFVLPSHREAFGEVFIEAMSFGLPCIGTRAGVMPELIEENNAGYVVTPGDKDEIAQIILDLISSEDELRYLGANGQHAVESEYQWSTVTSRIISQIEKFV